MRSMRQEGRKVDTVERGCSRVGAFRECWRLRLMVFTRSPGYRAFLYHDWLLPRAPDRSLVLSSRIDRGARGTVAFKQTSSPPRCHRRALQLFCPSDTRVHVRECVRPYARNKERRETTAVDILRDTYAVTFTRFDYGENEIVRGFDFYGYREAFLVSMGKTRLSP